MVCIYSERSISVERRQYFVLSGVYLINAYNTNQIFLSKKIMSNLLFFMDTYIFHQHKYKFYVS